MNDPTTNAATPDGNDAQLAAATPMRAFEPRPPAPMPNDWPDTEGAAPDEVPLDEPQVTISRPMLHTPRKHGTLPVLVGLALALCATGVGYHWYQRHQDETKHVTAAPASDDAAATPFSLRAAWRNVDRHSGSRPASAPSKVTPVVSVLDEPENVAPEPRAPRTPAQPPSAAALLAERMAGAATTGNPPPRPPEKKHQPTAADAPISDNPPAHAQFRPAPRPEAKPPLAPHVAPAPRVPPVTAERQAPRTVAETPSPQRPERAPGMVGLGGPSPSEAPSAPPRTIAAPAPAKRVPTAETSPSGRNEPTAATTTPTARPHRPSSPRRPYRRSTASTTPREEVDASPLGANALFKRLQQTMP